VECVPNVSEGRDPARLARFAAAVTATPQVTLAGVHADPDHHRSVFTFLGPPGAVAAAAGYAKVLSKHWFLTDTVRRRRALAQMAAPEAVAQLRASQDALASAMARGAFGAALARPGVTWLLRTSLLGYRVAHYTPTAAQIESALREEAGPLLRRLVLFDVFPFPDGRSSLAWRLLFQAEDRTLTDDEVNAIQERVVRRITETFHITLRSG